MKALALSLVVLLLPAMAPADIIEWQGADGVRHFTNLKDTVPADQRGAAQVVIDEVARRPPTAEEGAAPAARPAPAPERRREAEVVYDPSTVARAYMEGLTRGLEAGRAIAGGGGGSNVLLNGPLAVANATSPSPYGYFPYYYPFVTTSFDRGRSRHLTLRMLLEDQFAIDRAAPYVFVERLIPPLGFPPQGPDLNPFLARGLPHGFPRDVRVINY